MMDKQVHIGTDNNIHSLQVTSPYNSNTIHSTNSQQLTINNTTQTLTHLNNDSFTKNIIYKHYKSHRDYLQFATINIRGKFSQSVPSLLDLMFLQDIHVLGITETHKQRIPTPNAPYHRLELYTDPQISLTHKYHIFLADNGTQRSSGCGFILHDFIARRIRSVEVFQGRIIVITAYFKDKVKFKFINVYMPADNSDKKLFISLSDQLIKIISQAKLDQFSIILMGDFNANYHAFLRHKSNTTNDILSPTPKWKFNIFSRLKTLNLRESTTLCNNQPEFTWKNSQSNTWLDLIFISDNITQSIVHSYSTSINKYINTDHRMLSVILDFELFRIIPIKYTDKNKRNQFRRDHQRTFIYIYSQMTHQQWSKFTGCLSALKLELPMIQPYTSYPAFMWQQMVDDFWYYIRNAIQEAKFRHLPKTNLNRHNHERAQQLPLSLRQFKNDISKVQNILLAFSQNRIESYMEDSDRPKFVAWSNYWKNWMNQRKLLFEIRTKHKVLDTLPLPHPITEDNLKSTRNTISGLLEVLKITYKKEHDKWSLQQMDYFVNRRNDDIKFNQKRFLNSALNRIPQTIVLDRLFDSSGSLPERFTRDPKLIEQLTISHFKSIGDYTPSGNYNSISDLPAEWQSVYTPFAEHDDTLSFKLIEPITLSELEQALNASPNGKASGPTGIAYEDLKHLSQEFKLYLLEFFNFLFNTKLLPAQWKKAYLFPIAKPKPWGCDINNTCPIVLLETTRKLFVRILNTRLNSYLLKSDLLQHNNRAGVAGSSTLEPIQIISHIIEMSKHLKQDLFICLQDLSKAYDRVNIKLLRLALLRLNIPLKFVDTVLELFTDRTNSILITNFISSPYELKNGIDQGEVISPLLWICYYDPMFYVINNLPNPFSISLTKIVDINNKDLDKSIRFNCNVIGYLDDTTWFADSVESLESRLNIASNFYSMANIMVNFDKLKILSAKHKHTSSSDITDGTINLTISNITRPYRIHFPPHAERILGIYVSGNSLLRPAIKKARSVSYYIASTLRFKRLSHQHILYIINRVVIPRLLYILQSCFPLKYHLKRIFSPFKRLLKSTLSLPSSTPDSIIFSNFVFPFESLLSALTSQTAQNMLALFNNPLTFPIAYQKLIFTYQYELWYPREIPNVTTLISKPSSNMSSFLVFLYYINVYNISFTTIHPPVVTGGFLPVRDVFKHSFPSNFRSSLRNKRIIFMDQLVSVDGTYLLPWSELTSNLSRIFSSSSFKKGPIPKWFTYLEDNATVSLNRRLLDPLVSPIFASLPVSPTPPGEANRTNKPKNEWIATWDSSSKNLILGKTIEKFNYQSNSTPSIYFQHWIEVPNSYYPISKSPRKRKNFIIPC